MDLQIKDVANLLNVTEATVRQWISQNEIPAYRLHHDYYFSRTEIEKWVMTHRVGQSQDPSSPSPTPAGGGSKQFSLFRALHKGTVLHDVPGNSKEEIIHYTMQSVAPHLQVDGDGMTALLLAREELMSTGLARGIAVPHTRDFLFPFNHDAVVVAFLQTPCDYGALDGEPAHTLFFLFAGNDSRHLQLLAKIAHLSRQSHAESFLRTSPSKEALLHFLKEWEAQLPRGLSNHRV